MSEHTPGPWSARDYKNAAGDIWVDCDSWRNPKTASLRGGTLATVHSHGVGEGSLDANARLIAAAPDLLDALKIANASLKNLMNAVAHHEYTSSATQDWVERQQAQGLMKIGDTIAAAIAKAEGRA